MSQCKFCSGEITWTKDGRRNVAVNNDGSTHKCEEMKRSMKTLKEIEPTALSAEEISKYEIAINTTKKR